MVVQGIESLPSSPRSNSTGESGGEIYPSIIKTREVLPIVLDLIRQGQTARTHLVPERKVDG